MSALIKYTYNGLTLSVTDWAINLDLERIDMSNRIQKMKKGKLSAEDCFSMDKGKSYSGSWGDLSSQPRSGKLESISNPTTLDKELAGGKDVVRQ